MNSPQNVRHRQGFCPPKDNLEHLNKKKTTQTQWALVALVFVVNADDITRSENTWHTKNRLWKYDKLPPGN